MDYDEDELENGWRVRHYRDIGNGQSAMVTGQQTAIEFQIDEVAVFDRLLTERERWLIAEKMCALPLTRWQRFVAWVRRVVRR